MASVTIEAVYQDGILKPLQALDLPDNVHVWIQIIPTHGEEAMSEENRFKLRLVELGLLREVRIPSKVSEGDRTPIQVKGKSQWITNRSRWICNPAARRRIANPPRAKM